MTIVACIYVGHRIVTEDQTFTVIGTLKTRKGYKYICRDAAGRKVSLDRQDVLQAQREGTARVEA